MQRPVVRPYRVIQGIGAGAGAALAMMVVMALLRFGLNVPTIPELMLNPVVRFMGGEAFSAALDSLYYAGRPLLFTVMLEGTLLLGVLLGLLYAWLARPDPTTGRRAAFFNTPWAGIVYGLVIGVLLNLVFLPIVDQPVFADRPYGLYGDSTIPLWAGLMLLALVYGVTLHGLLPRLSPLAYPAATAGAEQAAPTIRVESPQSVDRRSFLRIAGGALLAVLGGVGFLVGGTVLNQGGLRSPVADKNLNPTGPEASSATPTAPAQAPGAVPTEAPTIQAGEPTAAAGNAPEPTATAGGAAEPPAPEATAPAAEAPPTTAPTPTAVPAIAVNEVTPTDSFYHVSKNFFDPSPSSNGWKLEIKGMVDNPYTLDYAQLTALPALVVTTGMMCISNPIGGGLIGNTTWKGVRMADLIKRAKPRVGVTKIVMRAVDDYADSIAIDKALDPDVMVVWEMGGQRLTTLHGFPARVLVPGIYGMKHVKWLTSIELVNVDFKGFWQDPSQGWSDPAPVNTMSRIDFPSQGTIDMKMQPVSGVAFAGDRSISKVELSTDGGKTWKEAYLKPPKSKTSWVLWGYEWTPTTPGRYTLMVRATDGQGNVQTDVRTEPYPDGATGYHTVTYNVRSGGSAQGVELASVTRISGQARKTNRLRGPGDPSAH